ncbi:hypothetical protein [Calothrix sp. NIES-2098]|uniref:hypothetical protein n=1 Tax=Calothrix sp. NIES-2098 TaxID=1954171 RepID=UPI000B61FA81|nr:hypothetical protein NIES2098_18590 [Calothrix sp. NIES-2098]
MSLQNMLARFDTVKFNPRTLQINFPEDLMNGLSINARYFFEIAYGKRNLTVLDWTSGEWRDDQPSLDCFFQSDEDTRTEILTVLTLFIHEYTHKIDFLISPFGLHFYVNNLREYWILQEFFPQALDNSSTVDKIQFLAKFHENSIRKGSIDEDLNKIWESLKPIIHTFYAWGDVSSIRPLAKFIAEGWSDSIKGIEDPFGLGIPMEPVTVLDFFHTFRISGTDKFSYLRPLTIFETKAVVNSLLFILYLLGEKGNEECLHYYEKTYLNRKPPLTYDYLFLLDLGARVYRVKDFHSLLKLRNFQMLRSTLLILSTACWYALQAPPFLGASDPRSSNPILRLWLSLIFLTALVREEISVSFNSTAEALLYLDELPKSQSFYQKPIKEIIPNCCEVIDAMIKANQKYTWHPDVKSYFDHIFQIMYPHFAKRDKNYISYMGMPDTGNPLFGCRSKEDWEVTYDDYKIPQTVQDWFSIRQALFFIDMNKPKEEFIESLDKHFLAFLLTYPCECGGGITQRWVSRFSETIDVKCAFCGKTKTINRNDSTIIRF